MTTLTQIQDNFYDWASRILPNHTIIWEDEDIPRPSGVFVSLKIIASTTIAHDLLTYNEDHTEQDVRGLTQLTTNISVYGSNAYSSTLRLRNSVEADESLFDLWLFQGRGTVTDVLDLTAEFQGKREERGEFKIMSSASLTETFNTFFYDQVNVTVGDETNTVGTNLPPDRIAQSGKV